MTHEYKKMTEWAPFTVGERFVSEDGWQLTICDDGSVLSKQPWEWVEDYRPLDRDAAPMFDYNDGKWHGWNGGECPVHPKSVVEVRSWAGCSRTTSAREIRSWNDNWAQSQPVCFRVTKAYVEPPKPREFWISNNDYQAYDSLDDLLRYDLHAEKHGYTHVREVVEHGE